MTPKRIHISILWLLGILSFTATILIAVENGLRAKDGSYGKIGLLVNFRGPDAGTTTEYGMCTTTLLCSNERGSVFITADHCVWDSNGVKRIILEEEVTHPMLSNPKYYKQVEATSPPIALHPIRSISGEVRTDGIVLLKVNHNFGSSNAYKLAKQPPHKVPLKDKMKYFRLVGYGANKRGFPYKRTRGLMKYEEMWNSYAIGVTPTGTSFVADSEDSSGAKQYGTWGDSGGAFFNLAEDTIWAIYFADAKIRGFNVAGATKKAEGYEEVVRSRLLTHANKLVGGCRKSEDFAEESIKFPDDELSVLEPATVPSEAISISPLSIYAPRTVPVVNMGENMSIVVAQFTQPSGNQLEVAGYYDGYYSARVDWGDGSASESVITKKEFDQPTQSFVVRGIHQYLAAGTYGVTVVVKEGEIANSPVTMSIFVQAPPPPPPPPE